MSEVLPRCKVGTGLEISRLVTGLWQVADMERGGRVLDLEAAAAAMVPYVEAGLTTFDMADHYGSAEEIAGAFQRHYGATYRVEFLTKWVPEPGQITRDDARVAIERALTRLNRDQIDLLQFHTWRYADLSWLDGLLWLQEFKEEGLIREIGLTNFDSLHLKIALDTGIEIATNQVSYSLLDRRAAGEMTEVCRRTGVRLLAYGTLAGGLLTDRWLGEGEPSERLTWSQMKYRRFIEAAGGWERLQEVLTGLASQAERHGVSIANLASRYVLEQPAVAGVIIGARLGESEHIEDNLRLRDLSLDDEAERGIERSLTSLAPIPGDSGDEYRQAPFLTASGDLSHHLSTFPRPYPVRNRPDGRLIVDTGTRWEGLAGFCRAIRDGDRILVAGTTATHGDKTVGGGDAASQFHFIVDKIEAALLSLGARLNDIVRTRVFVKRISDWEAVARAHGNRFGDVLPVNTLVQADLVGEEYLVEVEAEALLGTVGAAHLLDHE
ncbi:MAG: aldo/keto reductase [Trueperaceae bacterium]|nr:MAG: aldo/keto reductase [Trueperaceae bacterium]